MEKVKEMEKNDQEVEDVLVKKEQEMQKVKVKEQEEKVEDEGEEERVGGGHWEGIVRGREAEGKEGAGCGGRAAFSPLLLSHSFNTGEMTSDKQPFGLFH